MSGCVQTTGDFAPPTSPAVTAPIALNTGPEGQAAGGPAATPAASAGGGASTAAPAVATGPASISSSTPAPKTAAVPAPKPAPAAPAATTPAPTVASTGGTEPFPETAAPAAPPAAAATTDGYPNINIPPAQPTGTLLPPDERKRIISELEALRAKQGGPAPTGAGSAKALTTEAETHGAAAIKKIEACSEEGAADNPDCQPPAE